MVYSIKSFLQVYKNLTIYNSIIKSFSYILSYIRAVGRLPKCISKNLRIYIHISQKRKKKMSSGHVGVFCQNLGITAYTLENYSIFKNKFLFNNDNILEVNDCYNNRSRGNVKFYGVVWNNNNLSDQDFAGLEWINLDEGQVLERLRKCV